MQTADQVGDGAKVDELAHLQVIEAARGCDHNVHAALNLGDLAFPVPSAVDTDTERRRRRIQSQRRHSNCEPSTPPGRTWCSPSSCIFCTPLGSAAPALWWESGPTCPGRCAHIWVCGDAPKSGDDPLSQNSPSSSDTHKS